MLAAVEFEAVHPADRADSGAPCATRFGGTTSPTPSSIESKQAALRLYLLPTFGRRRLDAIKNEDVQRLKASLEHKSPKTVNNVLNVLSVLLKRAVEWEVIERMPCTVKLLRVDKGKAAFHDVDDYERLVDVARAIDRRTLLIVPSVDS